MAGRPAPRARLVGKVSPSNFTPALWQTRLAARSPASRMAVPPRSSATGSPECSTLATSAMVSSGTLLARRVGRGWLGPVDDSDHDESAGSTSVATQPGGPEAAKTASAASAPTSSLRALTRYQPETDRAIEA